MHTKLTIPERLKDLRVSEKRMSLQELSDATGIPSSTLGNYEKYNPRLLSELLTHGNFRKFMTDLEIYIDGFNDKGIQIANAFLDVMRCKLTELGADSTDAFASVFDNSHIESKQYYMNILSADLKPIVSDLRSAHMKDNNTASDIDYQSMIKNIIDDFATQIPTTAVEEKQT